jgi:hypothetical protein
MAHCPSGRIATMPIDAPWSNAKTNTRKVKVRPAEMPSQQPMLDRYQGKVNTPRNMADCREGGCDLVSSGTRRSDSAWISRLDCPAAGGWLT